MKRLLILPVIFGLGACSATQITTALSSPAGQLFCAVQTGGGGTIVVGLIDAASSAVPGAAPIAVVATNAGKAAVDADCAKASGVPVSPPAVPVANVAIVAPASPTTATVPLS